MNTQQKPTNEAIQQAILTLLGGLPSECEMHFGWDHGQPCLTFRARADAPENFVFFKTPDGAPRLVPGVLNS